MINLVVVRSNETVYIVESERARADQQGSKRAREEDRRNNGFIVTTPIFIAHCYHFNRAKSLISLERLLEFVSHCDPGPVKMHSNSDFI